MAHTPATEFAGTEIHGSYNKPDLHVQTMNKNIVLIHTNKCQKYNRYPPYNSYINKTIKMATIIGTIHLLKHQNTDNDRLIKSINETILELTTIGYPTNIIKTAIQKTKQLLPKQVKILIMKYLDTQNTLLNSKYHHATSIQKAIQL